MRTLRLPVLGLLVYLLLLLAPARAAAQDIDLRTGGAALTYTGTAVDAHAGAYLDVAAVGPGDDRKDLIVGAPGASSGRGQVYVIFSGPVYDGVRSFTTANATLTGNAVGDAFGTATAAGFVVSTSAQRDIVVGAPGARGGAGAVYLFPGPIPYGDSTVSSAALVIYGAAAGDNFGASLATADLDNDGFREIIVGAPGANAFYVFNVQRHLGASTIDLSAGDQADLKIVASTGIWNMGVGSTIEAGDVTGDGVYDLAIGAPKVASEAGAVYIIQGRSSWSFPSTLTLPNDASAALVGYDFDDHFGTSVKIEDFDRDGERDLLIGAPDAGSSRQGRVYYFRGGACSTPGTLLNSGGCGTAMVHRTADSANRVFIGPRANARLGYRLAVGHINRDANADFVALAPNNGAPELYVHYGRSTEPSVVDFSIPGTYDRKVIGAAFETLAIYEVTGEGARDIVAGLPAAPTSAGTGSGLVYIVISPRMSLTKTTSALSGSVCSRPLDTFDVENASVIPLPFSITKSVDWLTVSATSATTVLNSPAHLRLFADTSRLAPGTYSTQIELTSTSSHLVLSRNVDVTLTVGAAAPLAANRSSDFTADGCGDAVVFGTTSGTWTVNGTAAPALGVADDVPVPADYDGNGAAEAAVFRPSTATWYFANGTSIQFGAPGDWPVPADYDGDGRVDLAVYHPADGTWNVRGQFTTIFGGAGLLPVPADYDGDGRADLATFDPETATWSIRNQGTYTWGNKYDVPVPADYDGDGKADIAVFSRASATWSVRNQFTQQFGVSGDLPFAIDETRDGIAELGLYRPSTGATYFLDRMTGLTTTVSGGTANGVPAFLRPYLLSKIAGRAVHDFDGDAKTDMAFWRSSSGTWYVLKSGGGFAYSSQQSWNWGATGDVPVPGDYDGDGKIDIAYWRPSTGYWNVLLSSQNYSTATAIVRQWGIGADRPLPADYDGDGRTDFAFWRPSTGMWYILKSSDNFSYSTQIHLQWGIGDDQPLPGDYDGDGKADIAFWRPGTGYWYVLLSSQNFAYSSQISKQWGIASQGDVPLPADYDGDGRIDFAFWRRPTGYWYILKSSDNFSYATQISKQWGIGADRPVKGDFDGDGKQDMAFWRPGTGYWYILFSKDNFSYATQLSKQWGVDYMGDVPLGSIRP